MTATIDRRHADRIGDQLQITSATDASPAGVTLPRQVQLCAVWQRSRGVLLGQRWYLLAQDGSLGGIEAADTDLLGDACLELLTAWLAANGYAADDTCPLQYTRR